MSAIDDIKFTVISNCVASDLLSIEQDDYTEIIMKMKSLPRRNLESVLEILNMHVVGNISSKKKVNKHSTTSDFKIIKNNSLWIYRNTPVIIEL